MEIIIEFQEIKTRRWRLGHVDLKFLRLEDPLTRARFPCFDKFVDDAFGFAEDLKIRGPVKLRRRRNPRTANDDWLSTLSAEINNVENVTTLREHAAGKDHVGPVKVVVG
ncbi:MAG TPA: hypothetical protein VGG11_04520 [Xanthobacteraceae bacterium]